MRKLTLFRGFFPTENGNTKDAGGSGGASWVEGHEVKVPAKDRYVSNE